LLLVRVGDVGQVPGKLDWRGEHGHVVGVGDLPHLRHRAAGDHGPLVALEEDQVLLTDDIHLAHGAVPSLAERWLAPLVGDVEGVHPSQALRQRVVLRRAQLVQLVCRRNSGPRNSEGGTCSPSITVSIQSSEGGSFENRGSIMSAAAQQIYKHRISARRNVCTCSIT
jgi:hypothetical protein